jgi:hypothetical protein
LFGDIKEDRVYMCDQDHIEKYGKLVLNQKSHEGNQDTEFS